MKKLTIILAALLMVGGAASAQQSKSDESLEFRPHWSFGVQGGVSYTIGEAKFMELLSPAAQLSATYNFHNAMGVRFGLSGWQGKGSVVVTDDIYKFRFAQINADYVLNLANLFCGFKHDRVFNPYFFAGIGGAYGFDNKEAGKYVNAHSDVLSYYWESIPLFVGRAGLGADFQVAEKLSIGVEANANCYSDKLNSKKSLDKFPPDWQLNLLVGAKFRIGDNTRPSAAYVAAQTALAAAEAAARAEKAAAEKAAAEKAEAERLAAEKAAREKAEAERLAAEKAAAEAAAKRAALAAENSTEVFFYINSSTIRTSESAKLVKLAEWMKEHEDFSVAIVGYADKATGTPNVNMRVSEARVKAVKAALEKLGVPAERIISDFKGDSVQPYSENNKNRVVICTLQ